MDVFSSRVKFQMLSVWCFRYNLRAPNAPVIFLLRHNPKEQLFIDIVMEFDMSSVSCMLSYVSSPLS